VIAEENPIQFFGRFRTLMSEFSDFYAARRSYRNSLDECTRREFSFSSRRGRSDLSGATLEMIRTLGCRFFRRAFGWCVPIGALGGLIGLGGGEFRLPVLMYAIGFGAKAAVPLNLMVSLVTLAFSLIVRSGTVSTAAVLPFLPEVVGLAAGGILSAAYGARLIQRLSSAHLVRIIGMLLAAIGVLMLGEVAHPFAYVALLPDAMAIHVLAGFVIGIGIGLVSSLLGVAGGELLIPALIFIFGADIKTAGSASILISLGVVVSGLWRHWRNATIPAGRGVQRITAAMSAGSIIGAGLGGLAVAYAPTTVLKVLLGCVLIAAASKTIASHSNRETARPGRH
jgi:uncharacterized membrane protein YfcA